MSSVTKRVATFVLASAATLALACSKDLMPKVHALQNELLHDAPATFADLPACTADDEPSCLNAMTAALGSQTGYNAKAPDQATCAAAAVFLLRDKRGELAGDSDVWLNTLRSGTGDGVDTLRLAVATRMAEVAPRLATTWEAGPKLTTLLTEVTSAVPGACRPYAMLARGMKETEMPMLDHWHTSACVHKDMTRRDGPGADYSPDALSRTSAGAIALYQDTVRALRFGLKNANEPTRKFVEKKLESVEQQAQLIKLKLPQQERNRIHDYLGAVHGEVGIELYKQDGGAALLEAGVPRASATNATPMATAHVRGNNEGMRK
jgi:hypothetical protein